jgi:hypothetical protein
MTVTTANNNNNDDNRKNIQNTIKVTDVNITRYVIGIITAMLAARPKKFNHKIAKILLLFCKRDPLKTG